MRNPSLQVPLVSGEYLTSQHSDVLCDVGAFATGGRRLALRFDSSGAATYQEVTRTDVLKLVQSVALPVTAQATASPRSPTSRHNRLEIPNIQMRDLRKLDNVFATTNDPSLTVRQQAILVNADPVRAVILRDACLVFLPDGADSLVSALKACFQDQLVSSQSTAFEFAALEAVIQTVCKVLMSDCEKVLPRAKVAVDRMARGDLPMGDMEALRALKNGMHELETRVTGMRRMLMNILENEDDMRMMHLTKIYEDPALGRDLLGLDTDNIESLLEVYLHDIYATQTRVSLMQTNVQNTEGLVMLRLDTKRNYLLTVDLTLTMWTTMITVSTFVVGAFGMNLDSQVQLTEYMFWIVLGICTVFPAIGVKLVVAHLERRGINMSWDTK
ncbi:CorA Metal Ion Transporter (MIT) Family [Achlya hypogyna]|uniref:Magnesium transporter n=1 Tax=Achlya hypogyna TaxID=1202772 RepID=A0A1V9YUD7_ACHHY|nr:CorA Metal Ion Transporter (MIT) Family [Achlya hypogyna]